MHKTLLAILFFFVLIPAFGQKATDTFKLYFDLNIAALGSGNETKIDLLIYNDKIINGSIVMIVGYADYLGSEGHNKDLSIKRAENVKTYLVKYGINPDDITLCEGKGQVDRAGVTDRSGFPTDRRVDIVVNNRVKKKGATNKPKPGQPAGGTKTIAKTIDEISSLKTGSTFLLKEVYFPPDRHEIKEESFETLEKLYDVLVANPRLKISIEGHVCCIQSVPDALDAETGEPNLSVARAKEIYNYLVHRGIDPARLKYVGFGKSRPVVADEITDEDREKNRRVEIRVIGNK